MRQETTPPTSPAPGEDPRWREAAERAALAIYREGLAGGDPSASVILDAFADLRAEHAKAVAVCVAFRESEDARFTLSVMRVQRVPEKSKAWRAASSAATRAQTNCINALTDWLESLPLPPKEPR